MQQEDGTFPLYIACQKGFLRIVKALLSAGADPAMTMVRVPPGWNCCLCGDDEGQ